MPTRMPDHTAFFAYVMTCLRAMFRPTPENARLAIAAFPFEAFKRDPTPEPEFLEQDEQEDEDGFAYGYGYCYDPYVYEAEEEDEAPPYTTTPAGSPPPTAFAFTYAEAFLARGNEEDDEAEIARELGDTDDVQMQRLPQAMLMAADTVARIEERCGFVPGGHDVRTDGDDTLRLELDSLRKRETVVIDVFEDEYMPERARDEDVELSHQNKDLLPLSEGDAGSDNRRRPLPITTVYNGNPYVQVGHFLLRAGTRKHPRRVIVHEDGRFEEVAEEMSERDFITSGHPFGFCANSNTDSELCNGKRTIEDEVEERPLKRLRREPHDKYPERIGSPSSSTSFIEGRCKERRSRKRSLTTDAYGDSDSESEPCGQADTDGSSVASSSGSASSLASFSSSSPSTPANLKPVHGSAGEDEAGSSIVKNPCGSDNETGRISSVDADSGKATKKARRKGNKSVRKNGKGKKVKAKETIVGISTSTASKAKITTVEYDYDVEDSKKADLKNGAVTTTQDPIDE